MSFKTNMKRFSYDCVDSYTGWSRYSKKLNELIALTLSKQNIYDFRYIVISHKQPMLLIIFDEYRVELL